MAHSPRPGDEAAVRFHRIVTDGSLEELRDALTNGADVNVPGHVGRTPLMSALDAKDLEKTKLLIQHGADPERMDDFNRTALRHAVEVDFADGARLLLSLGVDRGYCPRYPLKKIEYGDFLFDIPTPMPT